MYKWICLNCKSVLDDCDFETKENAGGDIGEHLLVCPYCGCDEAEESFICDLCNEHYLGEDMASGHVCKACFNENLTADRFYDFLAKEELKTDFVKYMFSEEEEKSTVALLEFFKSLDDDRQKEIMQSYCGMADFADWLWEQEDI